MTDQATKPNNHLIEIKDYGQSIWMDNLTRDMIQSGELKALVENGGICGITTNPAILKRRWVMRSTTPILKLESEPGTDLQDLRVADFCRYPQCL